MSGSGADREIDERPEAWRRLCEGLPACSIRLRVPGQAPTHLSIDWRMLVASCWAIFWLFVFNLIDPLGVFSNADRYSGDLFHRAMAALNYDADPAADIAVILWTDLDLIEMERPWPVPYGDHAEALRLIREAKPKAVVVDIAFVDDRLAVDFTAPELIREISSFRKHPLLHPKTPPLLFIADPAPFDEETSGYEWALNRQFQATPVAVPGAAFERFGQQYPYMGPMSEGTIAYRRGSRTDDAALVSRPTAACAVFSLLHPSLTEAGEPSGLAWCHARSGRQQETGRESLMGVQWITKKGSEIRTRNLVRDCYDHMPTGVRSAAADFLQSRQTCGPFPTYSLVDLLVAPLETRREHLKDRVVFYGADILGVSDRVEPPTHYPLPGVFLHAMAYENLVRHDGEPLRTHLSVDLWLFDIGVDDLLFLLGLTLIVPLWKTAFAIETRYAKLAKGQSTRIVWRFYGRVVFLELGFILAAAVIVLCLILVGYPLLNLTPVNFIGLIGLVVVWEVFNLGVFIPPNGFGLGRWHVKRGLLSRWLCAPKTEDAS